MSALEDIAAERQRQIDAEGWTPEHDDTHSNGEMARAAAAYSIGVSFLSGSVQFGKRFLPWRETLWPWDREWWKPTDRRRDLVKAGALIVAEIDRLDRLAGQVSLPASKYCQCKNSLTNPCIVCGLPKFIDPEWLKRKIAEDGEEGEIGAGFELFSLPASGEEFPQPDRNRAGKEPCGECHVQPGETCDICGASHPASGGQG